MRISPNGEKLQKQHDDMAEQQKSRRAVSTR